MDGSLGEDGKTPTSYEYNVAVTAKVVEMAHAIGVSVEGELGCLGSLETGEGDEEDGIGAAGKLDHSQMLTDPDEAADFVAKTNVDALAIAIGTSHGAYKFSRPPTGDSPCASTASRRSTPVSRTPTWSCTAPPACRRTGWRSFDEYGGEMGETYGVPVEEIVEGIKNGVRKVNIDTDLRMAITGAIRQAMAKKPEEFDPRFFLKAATAAAKEICVLRFQAFGSAGQASRIKPVSLEKIAAAYRR